MTTSSSDSLHDGPMITPLYCLHGVEIDILESLWDAHILNKVQRRTFCKVSNMGTTNIGWIVLKLCKPRYYLRAKFHFSIT